MGTTWRESVLGRFPAGLARPTIALDPDGLLADELVMRTLTERGFELVPYDDPVAFRLAYESSFRSRWAAGENTPALLVIAREADKSGLPWDVVEDSPVVALCISDVFPGLAGTVVSGIDRRHWDGIYDACLGHEPHSLSVRETEEFILRWVFCIDVAGIVGAASLLTALLQIHYPGIRLPAVLSEYLTGVLTKTGRFNDWPIVTLVTDRRAFFAFLQERWPTFIEQSVPGASITLKERAGAIELPGPHLIPFDDPRIRTFIDDLFLSGLLEPVPAVLRGLKPDPWIASGLLTDNNTEAGHHYERLVQTAEREVPGADSDHGQWLSFALRWGEILASADAVQRTGTEPSSQLLSLRARVDVAFADWIDTNYRSLHSLPPIPPAMVHHVLPDLARRRANGEFDKLMLLVIDGLALDQWACIREELHKQRRTLVTNENAVFAWVPTLTSVSRQSLLAGHPPYYFSQSISDTQHDGRRWAQFWQENGLAASAIRYVNYEGTDRDLAGLQEAVVDPDVSVVALVLTVVDNIMHGMQLGAAGMRNQVRQWVEGGLLARLLDKVLDAGFTVFLTSDHGNVEAVGIGVPREGAVADLRGLRVRVYRDPDTRASVARQFPRATEWEPTGLPGDFFPLVAPPRSAFVRVEDQVVCHGGACLEEVVVPLVQITRMVD